MCMKNRIKYIKLLLSIIAFSISSIFTVFAEVEVEPSIDIYKSYEGWYKNFIVECGACRITLRNYDGSIINDYYVLPKQFENNVEITRILNYAGVDNQKDSEGRTILFMQKNDGKLNLNDYIYKALNGSELERKYSDNIPQLSEMFNGKDKLPYIYFEEFSEYTTVESWKEYNNGENVNKLATDLGINTATLCKNPIDNKEISFYEWVTTPNAEGVSPTLELQPITLYPETTEQIYCNDFYTAQDYNLQWNSDMGAYCEELNKSGSNIFDKIGGFLDGILMKVFGSKKIGIGDLITFYNGRIVYYDVGVMVTEVKEVGVETGTGKTYVSKNHARSQADIDMAKLAEMFPDPKDRLNIDLSALTEEQYNSLLKSDSQKNDVYDLSMNSEISKVIVKEILAPKYVPLTYTETTKYSHPWETKGFWANYQKIDVSNTNYSLEEMLWMYFIYNAITSEDEDITYYNINVYIEMNTVYMERINSFNELNSKTEQTVTNLLKSIDKYYLDFESFYKKDGYIREGDSFHLPKYKGIGDTTTIKTDHNKYVTIINLIEKCRKTFEILLKLPNFLCSNYPKYGAGIIVNGNLPIATPSEATKSDADPLTHDGFILYEDELSYVYTYDDIGNLDTRKLTGTLNAGSGIHGTDDIIFLCHYNYNLRGKS